MQNFEELINLFKCAAQKGWIESKGSGWGDIGLTFEKEINKLPDSKYDPDFKDIEIKCSSRFSRYPLSLFTIAFDGPGENEIMRLANTYGYYDHDFSDKKVLFRHVSPEYNACNKYNFMLDVDRVEEKVYLCVFDSNAELIERKSYVTFNSIKKHLYTKLKNMAYIKASVKKIDDKKFYRYYHIYLYKLKDFEDFLRLIEDGTLEISLISRIGKSGSDYGRYRNKNLCFSIKKYDINKLFDCIVEYDHDKYYPY